MTVASGIRLIFRHLAALAFLLLIFLPLFLLGRPGALGYDLLENRLRHDFPKSWSISYLEQVGSFFSDNHGFRNALALLGSRMMLALGINSTHPSVVVGEDGWLFYIDENSDRGRATMKDFRGRGRFTPAQLAAIRGNLESIGRAFRRCGVPFVVWVAPNKQTIYGEHLTGFREARGGKRLDQLLEALRGTEDLQWIDSRPALLAAKTNFEGRDLYFRTDTHWNGLGAFVAYESLMAGLEPTLNLPRLENLDPARYEIRISPFSGGDLSANMLNAQWRFRDSKIELVPRFPLFAVDVATAEIVASAGVAIPDLSGWANRAAVKTMVVYGDSFAKHVILYFREHFSRGYFIPEHVIDGEAVGKLRPDVVILEIVERNLASLLDKPKNLDKACRS